jgi:hypothetical protein
VTPLEKAHAAMAARRAAGIKLVQLNPLEKAAKNPTSLRLAINAKCWDCQGGDCDPGIRQRIGACSVTKCPLHPVRPYQRADESEEQEAA